MRAWSEGGREHFKKEKTEIVFFDSPTFSQRVIVRTGTRTGARAVDARACIRLPENVLRFIFIQIKGIVPLTHLLRRTDSHLENRHGREIHPEKANFGEMKSHNKRFVIVLFLITVNPIC